MNTQSATAKRNRTRVPAPYQSPIGAFLKLLLAKLLYTEGSFMSVVNTEYNQRRLLKSRGAGDLDGFPDVQFLTIPDGLPFSDADSSKDVLAQTVSKKNMSAPFSDLISNLNHTASTPGVPPVTCIFSDGFMSFATNEAAREFGILTIHSWTILAIPDAEGEG